MFVVESGYYSRTHGVPSKTLSSKEQAMREAAIVYFVTHERVTIKNDNGGVVLTFSKSEPHNDLIKKYVK